jgi:UDP-N-acetylglucosamine--N-acetylmuramyl-(pentapeptide) pyrophosphoryl-undecaprenol N-acetylglucosamine transferase
LKIPLVIHEQNARPGLANRFLARRAQLIVLTYAAAARDLAGQGELAQVGNPVRAALFGIDPVRARASFGIPPDALVLLAFGGSLGARHLNEALIACADRLLADDRLRVVHITGARDYETVSQSLNPKLAARWHLLAYCDRMGEAYAAADLVLSRAGATTLAELSALAKPALLIPYPHAAADEQRLNARDVVDEGGAWMLDDAELDTPRFVELLQGLLGDEGKRAKMRAVLQGLPAATARQELARRVIELARASY